MPVSGWELGREKFLCSAFFCSFVVSHPAAIFGEQNVPGVCLLLICERGGKKEGEICISDSFLPRNRKKGALRAWVQGWLVWEDQLRQFSAFLW